MGNGPSYFHSLHQFMETLWEQGSVLTEEEKIREASKSERQEKVEEGVKETREGGTVEMLLLAVFSGKDLALCVSFIVWLSLWQRAQKPPFIYPEHLALLRKGPERQAAITCARVTWLFPC